MGRQASTLMHTAFMQRDRFWNRLFRRKYTDSRLWQDGLELSKKADVGSILPPLKDQLRTPTFAPRISLDVARTERERESVVREVVVRRSKIVPRREHPAALNGGRLLLYAPDENLCDGAAEVASLGFFDVDNVPPWDTWVAFSNGTLLSWVPPSLVTLAQSGIEVNPECCILWMD
jgi:hypothetical protein